MNNSILVAGGTGDLGNRIIRSLIKRKANVVAIVRHRTDHTKVAELVKMGVKVIEVDMSNVAELTAACKGISCVVSALAGLREVIVQYVHGTEYSA